MIESWKYNLTENIKQRTFIAQKNIRVGENNYLHYAPAIAHKRWNGKMEYKIMSMRYDEEDEEYEVAIGGDIGWVISKNMVKQALENYIDLNLDRGKYAEEDEEDKIEYEKYP